MEVKKCQSCGEPLDPKDQTGIDPNCKEALNTCPGCREALSDGCGRDCGNGCAPIGTPRI